MLNKISNKIKIRKNDIIYTPKPVALKMIEFCNITENMSVLDPSKGAGVFYDNFPICKKAYCEITEGKDFFDWNERVDLVIGNPPYSLWNKWIEHTMKITDKFCYIMGFLNLTDTRVRNIINNGFGITKLHILNINWWFGDNYIVIFEKSKPSILSVEENRIYCDICNDRKCKRGRNGNDMNKCSLI